METTGGLTYAELGREDPLREVAMNSAFLQSSSFTSILAFGVAAMAVGMGLLFILIGLGIRDLAQRTSEPPVQVCSIGSKRMKGAVATHRSSAPLTRSGSEPQLSVRAR